MNSCVAFISGRPGALEIILLVAVLLLLFGAKRLPELSRAIGRSLVEFKKGKSEADLDASDDASKKTKSPGDPV